jgi:DNA-binding CsgD family transcriptional regulator
MRGHMTRREREIYEMGLRDSMTPRERELYEMGKRDAYGQNGAENMRNKEGGDNW